MSENIPNVGDTSHQEIAELERLLAEKKQALAVEGKVSPEWDIFRETFRETHGESFLPQAFTPPPTSVPPLPPDEVAKHTSALASQKREEQIESLIALAFSKGVAAATAVARHATPWLMDELHDRLADHYYQHLLTSRKLKAL